MKKLFLAALGLAIGATAVNAESINCVRNVDGYYEEYTGSLANYYIILSTDAAAVFNTTEARISHSEPGYSVVLDLYAAPCATKPIRLPEGTYTEGDASKPMTFLGEQVSYVYYFKEAGNTAVSGTDLTAPVKVSFDAASGNYTITTSTRINGAEVPISYVGPLSFNKSDEAPLTYPQIKSDLTLTAKAATGFYFGNMFESNTGNFNLGLYTGEYNPENGVLLDEGYCVMICLFGKLFGDPKKAEVCPGTYTIARNFKRDTFYPGMEVDYLGITAIMGSYVQHRKPDTYYNSNYGYSYITDGTVTITDAGEGNLTVDVDGITSFGHKVKATYTGPIPVVDNSDDTKGAAISTLEDDVECNVEQIKVARLFNNGVKNGYRSLVLDIGSPAGRDQELVDNGGDIMRFEMLLENNTRELLPGTYTVMEEKWASYYEPFKLLKGYFTATGDLTGTRYMHFIEGRYLVMDHLAPAMEGTLGVAKLADGNYKFTWELIDDANFRITGQWTGPMQLMFDPSSLDSSIDEIATETSDDEEIFDLMGRRADPATARGLYITSDGKKVVK